MTYAYICIAVLVVFLTTSTYFAIKFGLLVLSFQDALEESLEVIDAKYSSISEICERPLFYDSPEVRQVLEDIKTTRDSLHQVALSLSQEFQIDEEEELSVER